AVSGGADSMALLDAMWRLCPIKENLYVFHCNHRQRGDESDADASFVQEQSALREIPCFVARLTDEECLHHSEDRLRRYRYQYLREFACQTNASWIALGHNADDNIETYLHRLVRGSGTRGLSGIPLQRTFLQSPTLNVKLIRPLLTIYRTTILSWLETHGIPYRNDSSNSNAQYTRNRIRKELIPVLDFIAGTDWKDRITRLINSNTLEHERINSQAEKLLSSAIWVKQPDGSVEMTVSDLIAVEWPALREFFVGVWHLQNWPLREMSKRHWHHVEALLQRSSSNPHPMRVDLPGHLRLEIRRGKLRIVPSFDRRSNV
ncbi:MAG: tRNA lysidine(34) synthetase TilS, partial [Pirellula sp.]|nr:tRNA lysidine(34) synthetase TilS [Pirellula sp.]